MEETRTQSDNKVEQVNRLIRNHAIGAAAAGLIPIPLAELPLVAGIQLNLVRCLAGIYEVPFSEQLGTSLIAAIVGSSMSGFAGSLLKFYPVVGAVSASAVAAASTYALGKVFFQHFESGGTFLTLDPEKVKAHYAREYDKGAPGAGDPKVDEDYGGIQP